nr:uncharacterized protein LOC119159784 [Rhipicephalus microplus]
MSPRFLVPAGRCQSEWAYCFRTRAGIDTNMHLESMHRTWKHSMLEGRKNKRVDKLISALMHFDVFLMKRAIQTIKGAKGKTCKHIHCVIIGNTPSSSDDNDYESPSETASEMSQALHIMKSITKLDAATKVSSAALFKAKMESVKQAIVDSEVSEEVMEKGRTRKQESRASSQILFYKEARSSQLSSSLSKPTEVQKEVLKQQLMDRNVESAQIITSVGHDYSYQKKLSKW